jgi:alpha-beta hydrolase superfamily lysophospholipase
MQIQTFTTDDGVALARYHWPVEQPRCQVVISHGMSEHAGRYDDFARFLNEHGCEVWALDHRGHGQSVGNGVRGHFADQGGWSRVVDDMAALLEHAHAAHPSAKVVLFGHSMGSFVARATYLKRPGLVDGMVLSATGFRQAWLAKWMARIARWDGRRRGFRTPSTLMAKLVFGTFNLRFRPNRTPFDWLSREAAEVDQYIADPDCGFDCTPQLWSDLFDAIVDMEWREGGASVLHDITPIWLFAGSHDPVSMGGRGCRQLSQRYIKQGLRDVTVTVFNNGRQEMLNETNRDDVYAAFLRWLDRRFT